MWLAKILRKFFEQTGGANWTHKCVSGQQGCWLSNSSYCEWLGVGCAPNSTEVISLILPKNNLFNRNMGLPSSLFNLTSLQTLNLAYNNFGNIFLGPEITSLKELRSLDLSGTHLGVHDLSGLTNLRYLALRYIFFITDVNFLRNLTKLEYLDLSRYRGARTVTAAPIGSLHSLRFLLLADTYISNLTSLAGLSVLEHLDLSNSRFDKTWPGFSGTEALSHMTRLQYLNLGVSSPGPNPISNIIAPITGLSKLHTLRLAGVNLSCSLPPTFFSSHSNLVKLDLSFTNLTGTIPDNIHLAASLSQILLQGNSLTDHIPPTIGTLRNLTALNATHNLLNGHLPELSNFTQLQQLHLGNNLFYGPIPDLSNLRNLTVLNLAGNFLQGPLPAGLGAVVAAGLTYLDLSRNLLSGPIPPFALDGRSLMHLVGTHLSLESRQIFKYPSPLFFLFKKGSFIQRFRRRLARCWAPLFGHVSIAGV